MGKINNRGPKENSRHGYLYFGLYLLLKYLQFFVYCIKRVKYNKLRIIRVVNGLIEFK